MIRSGLCSSTYRESPSCPVLFAAVAHPCLSGPIIDAGARPPARPPFPVPRNFPFHVEGSGSHTSILMSESLLGMDVASTRQNAGRFAYGDGPPVGAGGKPGGGGGGGGGTYAPGATISAS